MLLCIGTPGYASETFANPSGAGTGSERCATGASQDGGACASGGTYGGLLSMVQLFADSQGMTLTRVDDSFDQLWTAETGAGMFGLARSAGRDFTLGVIPGTSGGSYDQQLGVIGSSSQPQVILPSNDSSSVSSADKAPGDLVFSSTAYDSNGRPIFTSFSAGLINSGAFRFAIEQNTPTNPDLWSSQPTDNRDSTDHMITFQLHSSYLDANNLVWYIGAFENAVFPGSDHDYNDYVFVFQNVENVTPEPSSAVPMGIVMVALIWGTRRASEMRNRGKLQSGDPLCAGRE
jgi:hypothetical protein